MHFMKSYNTLNGSGSKISVCLSLSSKLLKSSVSLPHRDQVGSTLLRVRGSSVSKQPNKPCTLQNKYCQLADLCVVLVMRTTVFHGFRWEHQRVYRKVHIVLCNFQRARGMVVCIGALSGLYICVTF